MYNIYANSKKELITSLRSNLMELEKTFGKKNSHFTICKRSGDLIKTLEESLKDKLPSHLNISDDLNGFADFLSESNLFKWLKIENKIDNRFSVQIKNCSMAATCGHPRLNPENKICPMAMVVGAFLKYNHPEATIIMSPSIFSAQDSETIIDIMK